MKIPFLVTHYQEMQLKGTAILKELPLKIVAPETNILLSLKAYENKFYHA